MQQHSYRAVPFDLSSRNQWAIKSTKARTRKSPSARNRFPLPFIWDPLIPENLENVPDLLKSLPSQAPALLALSKALLDVHMFTRTCEGPPLSTDFS